MPRPLPFPFSLRPGATFLGVLVAALLTVAGGLGAWAIGSASLGWPVVLTAFGLATPAAVLVAHSWRRWMDRPLLGAAVMAVRGLGAFVLPLLVVATVLGGLAASSEGFAMGVATVLATLGWLLVDDGWAILATVLAAGFAFWAAFYLGLREFSRGLAVLS